jgi:hypothetical protein
MAAKVTKQRKQVNRRAAAAKTSKTYERGRKEEGGNAQG